MQGLKITASDGTFSFLPGQQITELKGASSGLLTDVYFVGNDGTPDTTPVAAYDGSNDRYEYGYLEENGTMHSVLRNFP